MTIWIALTLTYFLSRISNDYFASGNIEWGSRLLATTFLIPAIEFLALLTLKTGIASVRGIIQRFLLLWLLLFLVHLFALTLINYFGFKYIDLRFQVHSHLFVLPSVQGVTLLALWEKMGLGNSFERLRRVLESKVVCIVLLLDFSLLLLIGATGHAETSSLSATRDWLHFYTGLKAIVVACLIAFLAMTRFERRIRSVGILAFSLGTAFYSTDHFIPWLHRIPGLLFADRPLLVQWILTYVPIFLTALFLFLLLERFFMELSTNGSIFFQTAFGFAFLSWLVVLIGLYQGPFLPEDWFVLVRMCGFFSISALLIAVLLTYLSMPEALSKEVP